MCDHYPGIYPPTPWLPPRLPHGPFCKAACCCFMRTSICTCQAAKRQSARSTSSTCTTKASVRRNASQQTRLVRGPLSCTAVRHVPLKRRDGVLLCLLRWHSSQQPRQILELRFLACRASSPSGDETRTGAVTAAAVAAAATMVVPACMCRNQQMWTGVWGAAHLYCGEDAHVLHLLQVIINARRVSVEYFLKCRLQFQHSHVLIQPVQRAGGRVGRQVAATAVARAGACWRSCFLAQRRHKITAFAALYGIQDVRTCQHQTPASPAIASQQPALRLSAHGWFEPARSAS